MKTDNLEKFVLDHKNDFDDLEPNPAIWNKIQKNEPKKIELNWTKILVRVAAVAVIFVSSFIFIDYMVTKSGSPVLVEADMPNEADKQVYQNLMEAEFYYSSMIDQRTEEFYQLAGNNSPLRNEINIELTELDNVFRELKEDLQDNADNEEVVVAMIQNYRLKLEILEEILLQLEPVNDNTKNDEDEIINL